MIWMSPTARYDVASKRKFHPERLDPKHFLRLANLDIAEFDRLGRYEAHYGGRRYRRCLLSGRRGNDIPVGLNLPHRGIEPYINTA